MDNAFIAIYIDKKKNVTDMATCFYKDIKKLSDDHNIEILHVFKASSDYGPMFGTEGRMNFERHCRKYGFDESDYRREFNLNGEKRMLIGFRTQNTRYQCICINENDGRIFKMPPNYVKRALTGTP